MKSHYSYMGIPARIFVQLNGKLLTVSCIFILSFTMFQDTYFVIS